MLEERIADDTHEEEYNTKSLVQEVAELLELASCGLS